ncbi:hypothetical protein PISMIDRAFT_14721 [Pisolithus microcarpus 441]|uniref:Unplaced genomic scaffold scaffold_132, whole genome shotgun sequence n=1 Tax=Pisolithus microcarpus 441 TaxID=765257 RepID=A0A0C9YMC4_9AGAM|nr:hypothetical protein PISMIDRAFT_14721 [Pisolithus microcarpus 441]
MWRVHPVFHTGRLLPYHETLEYGIPDPLPPPEVVDDEVEWEVDILSQFDLSSFDSLDEVPPPWSLPGQSFSVHRVPIMHGRLGKGKTTERGPPLYQSILFADGSRPGGVLAASACSTHEHELEGMSSGSTLEVPQTTSTMFGCLQIAIFDGRNTFDGKTEEQNNCIQVLSEIYRGTDITLDRVLEILDKSRSLTPDAVAKSIDHLLADLTINISSVQYRLVLKLASIYVAAKVRDSAGEDTAAAVGLTVGKEHPDVKVEEATPDPWSREPFEFVANDGYGKKRDACFSEAAKFLAETTSFAASAFTWRSFLDAAAWNKADHSLHNAVNTTMPIPSATFHPIIIDGML